MGFLKNFSEPFAFAMALWPFVSMLLTVPVLALLYHRDNRIRLSSAIVAYGTVLYLLGLLCFTLYPMPADAAAYCAAHHLTPQLNPLQFIGDIRTDGLTAVLQIAFNIVFFLPLGFIMGRIWRWPLPVTAVLSFATSLFLETMQLTGLMGVFPCAYRLFDVDDLLWNTTGALIGFALAMLSLRLIPARVADTTPTTTPWLHEAADHVHHRHDADRVRRDADASVRHDRPIEPALGLQRLMAVDGTVRLDRLDPLPGGAHPLRGRGAMVARRLYARRQLHAYDSGNPAARRAASRGVLCGAHGDADRRGVVA